MLPHLHSLTSAKDWHHIASAMNASRAIPTDADLFELSARVGFFLLGVRRQLVTAESCTGGWIGKVLTDVPDSSGWYRGGAVVYSNDLKQSVLGVSATTLATHGAVSEATAREMAVGALTALGGDVSLSVTGIAGPKGGQPGKPVGTVWFGWAWRTESGIETRVAIEQFPGDREAVRRQTVAFAFTGLLEHLQPARGL
jgi:nicotinamide-nucleotide amidase